MEGALGSQHTIVFLHVPKTAGATLRKILGRVYAPEEFYWILPGQVQHCLAQLASWPLQRRLALKVITGHVPYGALDHCLSQPLDYITLLRDPVERIRSLYQFVRSQPAHPYHALARRMTLAEFADADLSDLYNQQTRTMVRSPHRRQIDRPVLQQALHNLSRFAAVGVQEHFDGFVTQLAERYAWSSVPTVTSSNVAVDGKLPVSPRARERILANNALDLELHRQVCAQWDQLAYGAATNNAIMAR